MLTAIIIVARVQPGTSKGITDLLLPQPSSVLTRYQAVPLVSYYVNIKLIELIEYLKKIATRGCGHVRCLQACTTYIPIYKIHIFQIQL